MTTKPWRPVTLAPAVLVPLAAALRTAGSTAHAETSVNKIAHALRSSLVYVDRASGALSAGHAREPARHIRARACRLDARPVGGERRSYWDAGPAYGPWAGGYFGEYGSMLLPGWHTADDGETGVDRNCSFDTWVLKARRATCCS